MQYEEFLRKGKFTREEVPLRMYREIEKVYMERDDLFPDQESIISYFRIGGIMALSRTVLRNLDALRSALREAKRYDCLYGLLIDTAFRTAGVPECKKIEQ